MPICPTLPELIETDLTCHRCTYNLRGLSGDGRCPECGAPVEVTLAGDALEFADPAWLATLHRGGVWARRAIYAFLGIGLALLCWSLTLLAGDQSVSERSATIVSALGVATTMLASVLFMMYLWLFTDRNPALLQLEPAFCIRRIIRVCAVSMPVTLAVVYTLAFISVSELVIIGVLAAGAPFGVLGIVGTLALANYCINLAQRIHDRPAVNATWVYAIIAGAGWFLAGLGLMSAIAPSSGGDGLGLLLLGAPAILLGGGLLAALPARLTTKIDALRRKAEETWAAASRSRLLPQEPSDASTPGTDKS